MRGDCRMSINQALDYIYRNLDRELPVEEIAEKCCFSKFHLGRMFKGIVGEGIHSFIRRMRLERAAFMLRTSRRRTVTDIALEAGYSPSNFATAFRQYFGVSATEFRQMADPPLKDSFAQVREHIQSLRCNEDSFAAIDATIRMRRLPPMTLVYRRFIGNYQRDLLVAWEDFCREMDGRVPSGPERQLIGISYDDPLIADEDRCIYDMCLVAEGTTGADVLRLEGGLYACREFHGPPDRMVLAFNEIFALWLPFSRYEPDDRPALELYHTGMDEAGWLRAELCIPVRE